MREQDWTPMSAETAPEMPPITDFRRHMDNVMAGLAMTMFTLNFLGLNYLLSTAGILLMLTAFRSLRKTSRAFFACYALSIARAALHLFSLILNTTIYNEAFAASPLFPASNYISAAVTVLLLIFLRSAIRAAQKSVGLEPHSGSVTCLLVFSLFFFTNVQLNGLLVLAVLLAVVIVVIRCLFGLVRELDEAGFTAEPAPVRIPTGKLVQGITFVLAVGIVCGYAFGNRYPMDWQAVDSNEHAEVAEIKEQLLQLHFPEYVLNDLTVEDILACRGALDVVVQAEGHAANDGREVRTTTGTHTHISTVYDVEELRITGVGVRLPGEREEWILFHHFLWTQDPGFHGTEALQLWTADREFHWTPGRALTGRVLYDDADSTYTAPYHSLGNDTYMHDSIFWGQSQQTDSFATFSMPGKGENHRGYVAYSILENQKGTIVDSWVNYIHQDSWFQYPVQTAKEYRMNGGMFSRGPFHIIQDALQFRPLEDEVDLFGEPEI